MHKQLYLIGMTGGIACGKSTVLALLRERGAQTIDADQTTHTLQEPGTPVYKQIVAEFGSDIVPSSGAPLDRRKLGAIVFNDAAALKRLEAIVHPAVRAAIREWLAEVAQRAAAEDAADQRPVAVLDAIKLLESGWQHECDAVWVVTCNEAQQIARMVETRGMSEAEARQRVAAQPPQASRLQHADIVIDNSGTLEATGAQIVAAWAQIQNREPRTENREPRTENRELRTEN